MAVKKNDVLLLFFPFVHRKKKLAGSESLGQLQVFVSNSKFLVICYGLWFLILVFSVDYLHS